MKSISIGEWNNHKIKELFSMSHKIMDITKEMSEYNIKEMQVLANHSLELAKHGANNDFKKIEKIQTEVAIETSIRISEYRARTKLLLIDMHSDLSEKSANHMQTSLDSLADLIEHSDNKMPELNKQLGSVLRDMSAISLFAFEEGQKLLITTINNADKEFNKLDKSEY